MNNNKTMKNYKVKSNLKHNGEVYKKGDKVELKEEEAKILLDGNVVAHLDENVEEEETEGVQPAVNNVKREGDEVDGEAKVEPGKVEKPQPGDEADDKPETLKYKALKKFEYPKGTSHKVGDVLELTVEQVGKFGEGLIEQVAEEDEL